MTNFTQVSQAVEPSRSFTVPSVSSFSSNVNQRFPERGNRAGSPSWYQHNDNHDGQHPAGSYPSSGVVQA